MRIMEHLALASASAMLAAAGPLDVKRTAIRVTVVQSHTQAGEICETRSR